MVGVCVWVCVCRMSKRDFKTLAYRIVGIGKSEIHRVVQQTGAKGQLMLHKVCRVGQQFGNPGRISVPILRQNSF